jgi:hypothetical protein
MKMQQVLKKRIFKYYENHLLKWFLFFNLTLQYFVSLQTQNQKDAYKICREEKNKCSNVGCSKNVYDSEVLMSQLKANGKEVVHEDKGDIVVINTCGFIDNAKEESINTILDYVEAKNRGEVEKVFVTGCLSERYKPDLVREIPDVDQYFGTRDLPFY